MKGGAGQHLRQLSAGVLLAVDHGEHCQAEAGERLLSKVGEGLSLPAPEPFPAGIRPR